MSDDKRKKIVKKAPTSSKKHTEEPKKEEPAIIFQEDSPKKSDATNEVKMAEKDEEVDNMAVEDFVSISFQGDSPPKTQDQHRVMNHVFYFWGHVWPAAFKAFTIVVHNSPQNAQNMFLNALDNVIVDDVLKNNIERYRGEMSMHPTIVPLDGPGVIVFNIGLGDLEPHVYQTWKHRPIIEAFKSEKGGPYKLFSCTNHYSSDATPPVSIIMASDKEEAALFMMQTMKKIGAKLVRDMTVEEISTLEPNVYFLTPTA